MATVAGDRFVLDLSDDDGDSGARQKRVLTTDASIPSPEALIGDIREHSPTAPPAAPQLKSSTGFPEHRKRSGQSRFKQRRTDGLTSTNANSSQTIKPSSGARSPKAGDLSPKPSQASFEEQQRQEIDAENRRRLAGMSPEEIEKEQSELMAALSPSLIERLLKRANIDDSTRNARSKPQPGLGREILPSQADRKQPPQAIKDPPKAASVNIPDETSASIPDHLEVSPSDTEDPELTAPSPPADLYPASEGPPTPSPIHFPVPANKPVPNLDPSSPNFLTDLHTHYFPNLPANPSSLSWLQPITESESASSPYNPDLETLPPSAIRFSFTGELIAPRTALSIPTSKGLHHHAAAPESAGYTIPEISILSRSTLPAQRSVAWQVLRRVLFRLGKGQFGDKGHELSEGIWRVVEKEKVIERMIQEAGSGKHVSAKTWAVEGCWLWRMGGGERGTGEGVRAQ